MGRIVSPSHGPPEGEPPGDHVAEEIAPDPWETQVRNREGWRGWKLGLPAAEAGIARTLDMSAEPAEMAVRL